MDRASWLSSSEYSISESNESFSDIKKNLDNDLNLNDELKNKEDTNLLKVYLRVRPLTKEELLAEDKIGFTVAGNGKTIIASNPDNSNEQALFSFSKIFGENVNQKQFFDETTVPLIKNLLDGRDGLIFTYGVTNAGKTYTIRGLPGEEGILPRSVASIFRSISGKISDERVLINNANEVAYVSDEEYAVVMEKKEQLLRNGSKGFDSSLERASCSSSGTSSYKRRYSYLDFNENISVGSELPSTHGSFRYSLFVSYIEIYNEQIFDLLTSFGTSRNQLKLAENRRETYVNGALVIPVSNPTEVFKLINLGKQNLHVGNTRLNKASSRSHSIFSIKCVRETIDGNRKETLATQLSFCDLAGMERQKKTMNANMRLKEAGKINTAMLTLGKCIACVRSNQNLFKNQKKQMVPFRESKMTRMFRNHFEFGGICMLVNISPACITFNESLNVLKFSASASKIKMKQSLLPRKSSWLQQCNPVLNTLKEEEEEDDEEEEETEDEESSIDMIEEIERLKQREARLLKVINFAIESRNKEKQKREEADVKTRNHLTKVFMAQIDQVREQGDERRINEVERAENNAEKRIQIYADLVQQQHTAVVTEKNDVIEELKRIVEKTEAENEELKKELTKSREVTSDLQVDKEKCKEEIQVLKVELKNAETVAANEVITKCSICLVDNSEELKNKVADQQKMIEELKLEKVSLEKEINKRNLIEGTLISNHRKEREELRLLVENLKVEGSKVEDSKVEIIRLKSVIEELGESKSSSDERVLQIRQLLDEQMQKNVQLSSELLDVNHKLAETKKCLEEARVLEKDLDKENETLNSSSSSSTSLEEVEMMNASCMADLSSHEEESPIKCKRPVKGKTPRRRLEPQEGDEEKDRFLTATTNTGSWSSRLRRKK